MFDAWKERQRQRLKNRPERTVFYNIFATLMLVLAVELLMAVASILAVNVTGQLDENAKDLLTMRVRNRASYMQEILRNAEDLEQLSEQITATTQQLLKSVGDILVVSTMKRIGFTNTDYAKRHHGGYLGSKSREQSKQE